MVDLLLETILSPGTRIRAVPGRDGHRCGSCRFLDCAQGDWQCASVVRSIAAKTPMFLKAMGPVMPAMRLVAWRRGGEMALPGNPGWFACPLWLPGESMSVRAWRDGYYTGFLALAALADVRESTEMRGPVCLDGEAAGKVQELCSLARIVTDMNALRITAKMLVPLPYALGAAFGKVISSFSGLAAILRTGFSHEHH